MFQPSATTPAVGNVTRAVARVCLTGLIATSLSLTLTGCPKDPYDAKTWIDKLDDETELERAITELSRLKDPTSIAPLGETWRKRDHASRLLRVIIDIADQRDDGTVNANDEKCQGDDRLEACKKRKYGPFYAKGPYWEPAIPFLVEAIEEFLEDEGNARAIENGTVAADALGRAKEFNVPVDVEILIRAATRPMPPDAAGQRVRIAALRALGKFRDDPRAVDTLIQVLNTDLEKQHISLFAAAADALASARSKKAVKPLVRALFGISPVYQFCRRSLVAIGPDSIPELIEVFTGKNKEMNAFAKENKFAINCDKEMGLKTTCKAPSNLEFKSANVLGDLVSKEAVPHLVAALKEKPMPAFFGAEDMPGPAQHEAIFNALKQIGDPSAADPILDYILDKDSDEYLKPMAIDTYSFLTRDQKALPQLANFMKDDQESFQIRMASGLTYGRLVNAESQLEPINYMITRNKAKADEWDKKAEGADKLYQVVKACKDGIEAGFVATDDEKKAWNQLSKAEKREKLRAALPESDDDNKKKAEAAKQRPPMTAAERDEIDKCLVTVEAAYAAPKLDKTGYKTLTKAQKSDYIKLMSDKKAIYVKLGKTDSKFYGDQSRDYAGKEQDKYIAEGNANDYRNFQRTFEQNLARARVGVHCKEDPKCYLGYVTKSADEIAKDLKKFIPDVDKWEKQDKANLQIAAAERALLELAKMGSKAASTTDQLLEMLPTKERIIRQGALMALVHSAPKPCTKCVEKLDAIIAEQENQSTLTALTNDARVWRYYFTWAK